MEQSLWEKKMISYFNTLPRLDVMPSFILKVTLQSTKYSPKALKLP